MRFSTLLSGARFAILALPVLGIGFALQTGGCTFSDPPPSDGNPSDSGSGDLTDGSGHPTSSADASNIAFGTYGYSPNGTYGPYGYGYGYGCDMGGEVDSYGYGYDPYGGDYGYGYGYGYESYGYGYGYGYGCYH